MGKGILEIMQGSIFQRLMYAYTKGIVATQTHLSKSGKYDPFWLVKKSKELLEPVLDKYGNRTLDDLMSCIDTTDIALTVPISELLSDDEKVMIILSETLVPDHIFSSQYYTDELTEGDLNQIRLFILLLVLTMGMDTSDLNWGVILSIQPALKLILEGGTNNVK